MMLKNVLIQRTLTLCMLSIICSQLSSVSCTLPRAATFPNENTEVERLRQFEITHQLLLGQSSSPAADRKTFLQKLKDMTAKRQEQNHNNK